MIKSCNNGRRQFRESSVIRPRFQRLAFALCVYRATLSGLCSVTALRTSTWSIVPKTARMWSSSSWAVDPAPKSLTPYWIFTPASKSRLWHLLDVAIRRARAHLQQIGGNWKSAVLMHSARRDSDDLELAGGAGEAKGERQHAVGLDIEALVRSSVLAPCRRRAGLHEERLRHRDLRRGGEKGTRDEGGEPHASTWRCGMSDAKQWHPMPVLLSNARGPSKAAQRYARHGFDPRACAP